MKLNQTNMANYDEFNMFPSSNSHNFVVVCVCNGGRGHCFSQLSSFSLVSLTMQAPLKITGLFLSTFSLFVEFLFSHFKFHKI
jgi:hypothetical protein